MRQRVLVGVTAALEWSNLDQNGTPAAPGTVTAKVERADGTTVLPAGTATTAGSGTGARVVTLTPSQNDRLDLLKVTWTDAGDGSTHTTYHEVVGGYYFDLTTARTLDSAFASTATYPDADVIRVRNEVEDAIEAVAGVAFVPRFASETHNGSGLSTLLLHHMAPRLVRSVRTYTDASTFTNYTGPELAAIALETHGLLRSWSGYFARGHNNIVVEYEHGLDRPPALIQRAARILFRTKLLADKATTSALTGARSVSLEGVRISYGTAVATGRSTGVDEVDRLIDQWKTAPAVGSVVVA